MTDEQQDEMILENCALREALKLGKIVMDLLSEHGAEIVPHILDTDENPGERFRAAIRSCL